MGRKVMRYILVLTMVTPIASFAETYLCVSEAGAVVEDSGPASIGSSTANVEHLKYLLSNESGKWQVKQHGRDIVLFDKCQSPYFWEGSGGYSGTFIRDKNEVFTVIWITRSKPGHNQVVSAKGRCSLL